MSGEDLSISAEALRAAAGNLTGLVGSVPQHSTVDLTGCGSASVARAAAEFDLWVAITGRIASEQFQGLAAHATMAADAIDSLDEQLAAGTGV